MHAQVASSPRRDRAQGIRANHGLDAANLSEARKNQVSHRQSQYLDSRERKWGPRTPPPGLFIRFGSSTTQRKEKHRMKRVSGTAGSCAICLASRRTVNPYHARCAESHKTKLHSVVQGGLHAGTHKFGWFIMRTCICSQERGSFVPSG
ncbi:hypothetical protein B0H67DRAFT_395074 [Lasiosphaeris hirsuta]|uniref:Uncharacterized protein n=1 Tax=Lasiosphaeris hirsuta TaxID=260670 RepID=A0AA40DJM2_9PEZI|nr:hypothetical protein B0H67DRAFT_395074 [Lasiosphaeris hirsuta]